MANFSLTGISEADIEKDLNSFIDQLKEAKLLSDTYPGSARTILIKLLSGFFSKVFYKVYLQQRETYLSTATDPNAIYNLAVTHGYNMTRKVAPQIKIKYIGEETLPLSHIEIIGSFGDYDLIYWGERTVLEAEDEILCYVGKLATYSSLIPGQEDVEYSYIKFDENQLFIINIQPSFLSSVENDHICFSYLDDSKGEIEQVDIDVKKDIQDFILRKQPLDFSSSLTSTNLTMAERSYGYGMSYLKDNAPFMLRVLETDGYLSSSIFNPDDVKLPGTFRVKEFASSGSNGDSLKRVKALAPLAASTLNRASSANDIRFTCVTSPFIKEAYVTKDMGVSGVYEFDFSSFEFTPHETYWIAIGEDVVSRITPVDEAKEQIIVELAAAINASSSFISVKIVDEFKILITELTPENPVTITACSTIEGANIFRVLVASVQPGCCTVLIYYIKQDITRDLILSFPEDNTDFTKIELSEAEQEYYKDVFTNKLDISSNAVLIPATYKVVDVEYELSFVDGVSQEQIDEFHKKAISVCENYELKLASGLHLPSVTADLAQISVDGLDVVKSIKLISGEDQEKLTDTYYVLNLQFKII